MQARFRGTCPLLFGIRCRSPRSPPNVRPQPGALPGPGVTPEGYFLASCNCKCMELSLRNLLRSLLNIFSVGVTAFVLLVFLVGDWVGVYGTSVWGRVLWLSLLSSTQTFLAATWKLPGRLKRWIGWGRWILVGSTGAFLALAGVIALALSSVPGLFAGSFGAVILAGLILLADGLWMVYWISKHRVPLTNSIALDDTPTLTSSQRKRKGWPLHPKNFAIIMAVVFFASLLLISFAASGLPQPPSWFVTITAILGVLGGSCFAAWLSMSIYEFITREGQDSKHAREFAVDLVKTLYGPLYDELMRTRDRLVLNYELLGFDHLQSLHWRYLRLLVPSSLIDAAKGLEAMAEEYGKVFRNANQTLNRRGAEIVNSFVEKREGSFNIEMFSGNKDALAGGEWRAVLGTGDSGMKSNYDRLVEAVAKAVASGDAIGEARNRFMDEFAEGMRGEPLGGRIVEFRASLCALILDVVGMVEPLIQTPYLGGRSL